MEPWDLQDPFGPYINLIGSHFSSNQSSDLQCWLGSCVSCFHQVTTRDGGNVNKTLAKLGEKRSGKIVKNEEHDENGGGL